MTLLSKNDVFPTMLKILLIFTYYFFRAGDIICFIIAGILIFRKSRRLASSEHTKFEYLKKWYWMCLLLHVIIFTVWKIEVASTDLYSKNYDALSRSIVHFIIMYSSFLIFAIFMSRKDVRTLLLQKYQRI